MIEYPIIEEKILTGKPTDLPEYRVSRKHSSAKKKPAQSKHQKEKATPPAR